LAVGLAAQTEGRTVSFDTSAAITGDASMTWVGDKPLACTRKGSHLQGPQSGKASTWLAVRRPHAVMTPRQCGPRAREKSPAHHGGHHGGSGAGHIGLGLGLQAQQGGGGSMARHVSAQRGEQAARVRLGPGSHTRTSAPASGHP
jgi:hypothetical protein